MFRTLASFIFGETPAESSSSPQVPVECETREVNDWLVVNMPDHEVSDVEFDDDNDDRRLMMDSTEDGMDLFEIMARSSKETEEGTSSPSPPELMDDDSDEDVLESVPRLMQPDCYEYGDEDGSYEDSDEEEEEDDNARMDTPPSPFDPFCSFQVPHSGLDNRCQVVQPYYETVFRGDLEKRLDVDPELAKIYSRLEELGELGKMIFAKKEDLMQLKPGVPYSESRRMEVVHQKCRELQKAKAARAKEAKRSTQSNLTCHPVYSSTYVNHRHPTSPPKTDLQQKIKDLKPQQVYKLYIVQKENTRGNLNRQNKNYIYECSTKTNRRKDFQRNLSGANNNRKSYKY